MAGSGSALVAHESESDSDGLPSFDDDSQSSSAEDDEDERKDERKDASSACISEEDATSSMANALSQLLHVELGRAWLAWRSRAFEYRMALVALGHMQRRDLSRKGHWQTEAQSRRRACVGAEDCAVGFLRDVW